MLVCAFISLLLSSSPSVSMQAEGVEDAFMQTVAAIWIKYGNGELVLKADEVSAATEATRSIYMHLPCSLIIHGIDSPAGLCECMHVGH
jgi:hypothetical protein